MKNFAKVFQSLSALSVILTVALIGIAALCLTGCRPSRPLQREYIVRTDSLVIQSVTRDTVVRVAQDSSSIRALLECDSLGQVHIREILSLKSGLRLTAPTLKLNGNTLTAQAKVDSMSIYLTLRDRLETRIRDDTRITEKEIPVYRLRGWQEFLCWSGALLWMAMLIYVSATAYTRFKTH